MSDTASQSKQRTSVQYLSYRPGDLDLDLDLRLLLPPVRRPYKNLFRSFDIGLRCMKLQNPPRVHSPISYCLQQASLKSVTGDSSACIGWPLYHLLLRLHHCLFGIVFSIELDIDIAYQVVPKVIADIHFFNLSIFVFQLDKNVLEKFVEMRLFLLIG